MGKNKCCSRQSLASCTSPSFDDRITLINDVTLSTIQKVDVLPTSGSRRTINAIFISGRVVNTPACKSGCAENNDKNRKCESCEKSKSSGHSDDKLKTYSWGSSTVGMLLILALPQGEKVQPILFENGSPVYPIHSQVVWCQPFVFTDPADGHKIEDDLQINRVLEPNAQLTCLYVHQCGQAQVHASIRVRIMQ